MSTPPRDDELELSLFGPGYGECAVVHLGQGQWMVIDSCLNESGDAPVASEYLTRIGVDVRSQVNVILVTHWHDDHVRGVGSLIRQAENASFVCSAALRHEEFCQLMCAADLIKLVQHTSGASELSEVFAVLRERRCRRGLVGPDLWAQDGSVVYRGDGSPTVMVWALSPSSQTVTDTKVEFAKLLPQARTPIRRLPSRSPNEASVALLVNGDEIHLLLGGDLQVGADRQRGWLAVVSSPVRPKVRSSAYKVAHHGSSNADHDTIWSELLTPNPLAFVSPNGRLKRPIPTEGDIRRMKGRGGLVYSTVWPPTLRATRLAPAVERTLKEMKAKRRSLPRGPGHIRLRVPLTARSIDDGSIELLDGAKQL